MSGDLRLLNRQRARAIDSRALRQMILTLLGELLEVKAFDLTVHLVNAREMARLNKSHLNHDGPTDVITLDYSDGNPSATLTSELFVCVDEAKAQARVFRVTPQTELVRYIVHGILHLQGYDDRLPTARRRMKSAENRLLRELSRRFGLSKPPGKPKLSR